MPFVDSHLWTARRSGVTEEHEIDMLLLRTPFEKDKARIIHSACFRRLQSKTQLFDINDFHFTRTRLTHSLEVMNIATSIVRTLKAKYDLKKQRYKECESTVLEWANLYQFASLEFSQKVQDYLAPDALIEAISLVHDIGHPPYGHAGEYALNQIMFNYGNFEGNAQSLRNVAYLENFTEGYGLDLTRRTLLGIIKYPALINLTQPKVNETELNLIDSFNPGKGIYLEDKQILDWILEPFSEKDKATFATIEMQEDYKGCTKLMTVYKSFDCSIMELADDIAYCVHDLEDALKFKVVSYIDWLNFYQTLDNSTQEVFTLINNKVFANDFMLTLFQGNATLRKRTLGKLTQLLITHINIKEQTEFEHPLLSLKAVLDPSIALLIKAFKNFSMHYLISQRDVIGVNNKGQKILKQIFIDISNNPAMFGRRKHLQYAALSTEQERKRFLCDYLASFTNQALDQYYQKYCL